MDKQSENKSDYNTLFRDFKIVKLKPNLLSFDVLGDNIQEKSNTKWRKLGELIARHVLNKNQRAILVSTVPLDYLTYHHCSSSNISTSFKHEGKIYMVTAIDPVELLQILPDIIETEEFVCCLNVWLYFFDKTRQVNELLSDEDFRAEVKNMISNLNLIGLLDLKYELIAGISDGCEMWWFNPS